MADIDVPLSWRMQQDGYLMQIDQLRTENANIRDGFHAMQQLYEDELKHALDENTKLRKLVGDLYAFYAWADGATHYGGEPAVFSDDRREVEQRMFELGLLEAHEV